MKANSKIWKRLMAVSLASLFTLGLAGCPDDGPAEEIGEAVDDAGDDIGDALD